MRTRSRSLFRNREHDPERFSQQTDGHIVCVVADAIAQMTKIREEINSIGPLQASESKLIIAYQKFSDVLKKYIGELGMSPTSRGQLANILSKEQQQAKDPLLQVLKKNNQSKGSY